MRYIKPQQQLVGARRPVRASRVPARIKSKPKQPKTYCSCIEAVGIPPFQKCVKYYCAPEGAELGFYPVVLD